eukprot:PhM_4_TR15660/c0_g1_i1/m.87544
MSDPVFHLIAVFTPLDVRAFESLLRTQPVLCPDAVLGPQAVQVLVAGYTTNFLTALKVCSSVVATPVARCPSSSLASDSGVPPVRSNALTILTRALPWIFPVMNQTKSTSSSSVPPCGTPPKDKKSLSPKLDTLKKDPRAEAASATLLAVAQSLRSYLLWVHDHVSTNEEAAAFLCTDFLRCVLLTLLSNDAKTSELWQHCEARAWKTIAMVAFDPRLSRLAQQILCLGFCGHFNGAMPIYPQAVWEAQSVPLPQLLEASAMSTERIFWGSNLLCLSLRDGWFDPDMCDITLMLLRTAYLGATAATQRDHAELLFGSSILTLLHCSAITPYVRTLGEKRLPVDSHDNPNFDANGPFGSAENLRAWFGIKVPSSSTVGSLLGNATYLDLIIIVLLDIVFRTPDRWPSQWFEPVAMIVHNAAHYMKSTVPLTIVRLFSALDHTILDYERVMMASPNSHKKMPLERITTKPMRLILTAVGSMLQNYNDNMTSLLQGLCRHREAFECFYETLTVSSAGTSDAPYPLNHSTRTELAALLLTPKVAADIAVDHVTRCREHQASGGSSSGGSSWTRFFGISSNESTPLLDPSAEDSSASRWNSAKDPSMYFFSRECSEHLAGVSLVGMLPCPEEHIPQGVHESHWLWHGRCLYEFLYTTTLRLYSVPFLLEQMPHVKDVHATAVGSPFFGEPAQVLRSITSDNNIDEKENNNNNSMGTTQRQQLQQQSSRTLN